MDFSVEAPSPLALLLELGQAFHSTLELDPLLVAILKQMQLAASSEGVSIWLLDEDRAELTCTHAVGPSAEAITGETLPGAYLAASGLADQALRLDDCTRGPDAASTHLPAALRRSTRNAIVAPLVARGALLGMLAVTNKLGQAAFTEDDRALVAALAAHAAVAIQNAQLFDQQRRANERRRLLEQISRHMQQTLDIDHLIPLVLDEVNTAIEADAQSLWLLNADTGQLVCRFATGPGAEAIKKVTVPLGKGIVGTSVLHGQAIMIADAQHDERVFRAADDQTGFVTRSLLCVPLVRQGMAVGAIEAVNKRNGGLFTKDDLELLRSIADSATLAIENARLYAELAASYDSTLEALAAALDLRDRESEGHSRRVVEYTACLARKIGMSEGAIGEICRGALIHDIGKIGIPDAILHKPAALSPDERRIVEKHPQAGYEMLLGIPYLKEEIQIVLAHHEHWDGTGYPLGLRGTEIPLGARLFAIADTFDALTSDRVYRRSVPYPEACRVIRDEAGRQFDPELVAAFLAVPWEEWEAIRDRVMSEVGQRRLLHDERVRRGATSFLGSGDMRPRPRTAVRAPG